MRKHYFNVSQLKTLRGEATHYLSSKHNVNFQFETLFTKSRDSIVVFNRALVVLYFKTRGYGCAQIGQIINRDHATVLHSYNYGREDKCRSKDFLKDKYNEIKAVLEGEINQAEIKTEISVLEAKLEYLKSILN